MLNSQQFSAYDERPDPKKPGQQGTLFRKVAPARSGEGRQIQGFRQPEKNPATGYATGFVPGTLYHGTSSELRPRSLIRAGKKPQNWPGVTKDTWHEHSFATGNLSEAYHFAMRSAHMRGGRPRIYKVQSQGPLQVDQENRPYDWPKDDQWEDYEDSPEEVEHFQTKSPLKVIGRVPLIHGKEAYEENNEDMGLDEGYKSWMR